MSSSLPRAIALGLLTAMVAGPASAAERTPFETVKGWEIERTIGDTSANPCLMSHSYKDKDDKNAENAVVFALNGEKAVLVLGYENWEWDKDEKVKVPFALGKKVIDAKSAWVGEGNLLKARFPDTVVPDLLAAKTIILRFPDSDADFDITGFPAAYESLRRCDAAKPQVAAAPAPQLPSEAEMKTYLIGALVEQVIRECEVATTTRQRTAFEARMAAMRPKMTAIEDQVREQVAKRAQPRCPPPADEPKFKTTLRDFLETAPEEFVVSLNRREAEDQAAKAAAARTNP